MKPTAEQRAAIVARILGVMPRTGSQDLDTAGVEIGILIGELCETAEAAEHLANQLTRHPWRRWNFPEFRAVAERLAAAIAAPEFPTGADLRAALVPDVMAEAQYEALYRRAALAGLNRGDSGPDVIVAESVARAEATAYFDKMPADAQAKLMDECRAEFREVMRKYGQPTSQATEPPYLDRNARTRAEIRIYNHLVLNELLFPAPEKSIAGPPPEGPSETLGQKALRKLAQKKRL